MDLRKGARRLSLVARLESDSFRSRPLPDRPIPPNPLKSGSDKLLALVLLIATAPLWMLVIAASVLLAALHPEDRGPLFFWETRISQGRPFSIPKFRILRMDVIERESGAPGFSVRFHQDDANCTRLGRWLKKYYLDELPQFAMILRGRMSFVGPRPRIPEEYAKDLARDRRARKYLKCGLTGLSQINKARLGKVPGLDEHLDEQYLRAVAHLSPLALLALDAEILWRTIRMMARGEGL